MCGGGGGVCGGGVLGQVYNNYGVNYSTCILPSNTKSFQYTAVLSNPTSSHPNIYTNKNKNNGIKSLLCLAQKHLSILLSRQLNREVVHYSLYK